MRMQFSKVSLAALALLFMLQVSATQRAVAQNYYVSTTGSDSSGNGSTSQPWATIAHASTQVGAGATVHVAAGTYNGSFNTSSSGTASAYITYVASTANFSGPVNCAQVAANQGSLSSCVHLVGSSGTTWTNSGNYVAIQGFDVTGPGINGIYTQGNATKISGNHVHDILTSTCNSTGGSGINLNGTNAQVTDNYVHNIGPYPSACGYVQGIYFLQAGGFAYNNISFANSGFGIQLWHYPANIVLVNNTLFNNASGGIVLGTDDSFTVDYITVSNNVVVNNGGVGVAEQGASSSSTGIHNIYTHNLVYGNTGSAFSLQNGLTASATVTSAPNFVNDTGTMSGNYHLQSTSPAIGAALGSGSPATDFDGNARPQSSSYDIGSYEYLDPSSAALSVSPSSLGFATTTIGVTSPTQTVTLSNKSTSAVSLSGIAITGTDSADFTETNQCGSSLAAGASCAIDVAFQPQTTGTLTATLTITPTSGSVLQLGLSGTGESATATSTSTPTVSLSPSSLSFPSTAVGSTSSAETVTITNSSATVALTNLALGVSSGFKLSSNTCSATLAAGASCTAGVAFAPTSATSQSGKLTVSSSVLAASAQVPLSGTESNFTATVSGASSPTVSSGQTAKYTLTIRPTGSAATFKFQCGSLPAYSTCTFSPTSETVAANSTGTETIEVATGQASASALSSTPAGWHVLPLACGLFLLPLAWWRKRKILLMTAVLAIAVGGASSCGGMSRTNSLNGPGVTPAGTYSIPVTVLSNGASQQVTLTLTVN